MSGRGERDFRGAREERREDRGVHRDLRNDFVGGRDSRTLSGAGVGNSRGGGLRPSSPPRRDSRSKFLLWIH